MRRQNIELIYATAEVKTNKKNLDLQNSYMKAKNISMINNRIYRLEKKKIRTYQKDKR